MRLFTFLLLFLSASVAVLPQTRELTIAVEGLEQPVTVRRDSRHIPYIEATNEADLYFAQGYMTATDRLWQMDLLRRVARGTTAEIFGKSTVAEDKRWRRFGFASIAEASVTEMRPELRKGLERYAAGVNAYIASLKDGELPVEFRILRYRPSPWLPSDSVIIGKILAESLSSTYSHDLMRASLNGLDPVKLADLQESVTPYDVILFGSDKNAASRSAQPEVKGAESSATANLASEHERLRESSLTRLGLFAEDLAASNNWVISGKRTASGKPILANDPHLNAAAPGIWYLVHLSWPGNRVAGATFPGSPGVILGHNESIAWGATNVGPDVQDLYLETFDADGNYLSPEGPKKPTVRREEIRFRENPLDPKTSVEILEVVETRNGPIVVENGDKRYALKWTAFDAKYGELETFYFLNRAKNWNDFRKALSDYGGPMQNFIYADTSGNIGWYAAGRVPIRRVGFGEIPYDGRTSDGDWVGTVPFDALPHKYNPPEGFIVTANQRIAGTDYKYQQVVRDFAPPWRARRLFDLISNNVKTDLDDTTKAQMDGFNIPYKMLAEEIVARGAGSPDNIQSLKKWDGMMTPDSYAALLVNEVRICVANKIADANKPVPAYLVRERLVHRLIKDNVVRWLPPEHEDFTSLLRSCDEASKESFAAKYGADRSRWTWGRVSESRFPHPLAVAPLIGAQFATPRLPITGSGQTPNVGSFVSMRHVTSPGEWDSTRFVIPLGQSGDPRSPHFKDQFEIWKSGAPAIFPFSKAAVEKATTAVIVMRTETAVGN